MSETVSLEFATQIEADLESIQGHIVSQLGEHALMPWALSNLEFHSHVVGGMNDVNRLGNDVKRLYVPGEDQLLETIVVGPDGRHVVDVRTQTEDGESIHHETTFWPSNTEKSRDPISAVFSVDAKGTIIDSLDHQFTNHLPGSTEPEVFKNTGGTRQLILMLDKMLTGFVQVSDSLENAIMLIDNPGVGADGRTYAKVQPTPADVDVDRALREERRRSDMSLHDAIAKIANNRPTF